MQLNDEGAALLAQGLGFLQGTNAAPLSLDQCRWLDMDLLASFYEVLGTPHRTSLSWVDCPR